MIYEFLYIDKPLTVWLPITLFIGTGSLLAITLCGIYSKKCHKSRTGIFLNSRHTRNYASWHVISNLVSDLRLRSRHNSERKHENDRSVQNHERERLLNFHGQETLQSSVQNQNNGNHVRELGRICHRHRKSDI